MPPNQSLVGNGAPVKSCCVHLPREPWHGADAEDEEDFPSVNSVLVENENCDTKVGFLDFVASFLMFLQFFGVLLDFQSYSMHPIYYTHLPCILHPLMIS